MSFTKQTYVEKKKTDNNIFGGWGYIFLCLPTYNSNFRHVETKYLVPNASNLEYYIVLSNSLNSRTGQAIGVSLSKFQLIADV